MSLAGWRAGTGCEIICKKKKIGFHDQRRETSARKMQQRRALDRVRARSLEEMRVGVRQVGRAVAAVAVVSRSSNGTLRRRAPKHRRVCRAGTSQVSVMSGQDERAQVKSVANDQALFVCSLAGGLS